MDQQQQQQRGEKRRWCCKRELGGDLLRSVFEFASLDAFVFWPSVSEDEFLWQQIGSATACSAVSRAWHHSSATLPTRICGQPPGTFGDDEGGKRRLAAFELLTRTRQVESLDLCTLGNHAKKPPISGRTRVDLDALLSMTCLKNLRISASALWHSGTSLKSLALAIASSSVNKVAFRLKTGDQKPKAFVVSSRHKDQPLHKLAEAILASPDASRILAVRYEQRPGFHEEYSRSLVITRRRQTPTQRFSELLKIRKKNDSVAVDLDAELTLLLLYSPEFAREAADPQLPLSLRFENRMSDAEIRRFHKLPQTLCDLVLEIAWPRDESRGIKIIHRLPRLATVGPLRLTRRNTFAQQPCFDRIVQLNLTGEPSPTDVPPSCVEAKLVHTIVGEIASTETNATSSLDDNRCCPIVFDFSKHVALKKLCLVGHRATLWVVKRFPPNASIVDLENILVRPDAHKISPTLDTLRLEACGSPEITDTFLLTDWLSKTGCKDLSVANCDRMNWSLGANLEDLCATLRKSRVERLRISALLASGTFRTSSSSLAQCGGRQRAVVDALDHESVLRRQNISQNHLSQLRQLVQSSDSVFFDLYYRTGESILDARNTQTT